MSKPLILELKERTLKNIVWTNTNWVSFDAQTVNVDLNKYDYFIVLSYVNPSSHTSIVSTIVEKSLKSDISYVSYWNGAEVYSRNVEISSSSIILGNCSINGSANNARLIPYKIIGCKY